MKVLSIDTGKKHFAWALCSSKKGVIENGMIEKTITSLSDRFINKQFYDFKKEFKKIRDLAIKNKCIFIIAERFQSRPGGGFGFGANAEYINVMIGVMGSMCRGKILFKAIMPSVWKTYFKRKLKLDKKQKMEAPNLFGFYDMKKNVTTYPILEHQFDACGIGLHSLEKKLEKPFIILFRNSLFKLWKEKIKETPKKYKGAQSINLVKVIYKG